jgi:hypothetical protein
MYLYILRFVLWCPLRFPHKNDVLFRVFIQLFVGWPMSYLRYLCLVAYSGVLTTWVTWCLFTGDRKETDEGVDYRMGGEYGHRLCPIFYPVSIRLVLTSRWIYNYLCNQCLSPLTLWVGILFRRDVLDTKITTVSTVLQCIRECLTPHTPTSATYHGNNCWCHSNVFSSKEGSHIVAGAVYVRPPLTNSGSIIDDNIGWVGGWLMVFNAIFNNILEWHQQLFPW